MRPGKRLTLFSAFHGSKENMTQPVINPCYEPYPITRKGMLENLTGYWREMRPFREERLSPCRAACPAGEDIPSYVALALNDDLEGAFFTIIQENPLPSVCGRVCYHPCEDNCLRSDLDSSVSIHRIERFVGDYGLNNLSFPQPEERSGASVAVVGSGPAGLSCAYHACRLGQRVTIFEAEETLGGMLRHGIPAYRLPRDILDRNLEMILDMGIESRTRFCLGESDSWKELDRFDAVFLALGAHDPIMPDIQGMDHPQVLAGLDFLKGVNSGRSLRTGARIAVVGGGNTAIDAARASLRTGSDVIIIYRRSRNEMPANPEETSDAINEGARLMERTLPVAIDTSGDGGLKITCVKTEPYGQDNSGRMRYEPVKDSDIDIEVDTLIMAIGQSIAVPEQIHTFQISSEGISVGPYLNVANGKYFAGGDVIAGPRRVCDAIGSGKLAALSIHARLEGLDMESIWPQLRIGNEENTFSMQDFFHRNEKPNPRIQKSVRADEVKPERFAPLVRPEPPKLTPERSIEGFEEVVGDVDLEELHNASRRCFSCGTCTRCDICYQYCPDMSVLKNKEGYDFNYDYCKGCAICAEECPRGVIHMEAEKS